VNTQVEVNVIDYDDVVRGLNKPSLFESRRQCVALLVKDVNARLGSLRANAMKLITAELQYDDLSCSQQRLETEL
jgi:hypothetical protein